MWNYVKVDDINIKKYYSIPHRISEINESWEVDKAAKEKMLKNFFHNTNCCCRQSRSHERYSTHSCVFFGFGRRFPRRASFIHCLINFKFTYSIFSTCHSDFTFMFQMSNLVDDIFNIFMEKTF